MLTRIGNLGVQHPRRTATAALLFFVIALFAGGPAAGLLKARNGFQDSLLASSPRAAPIERATGAEPHAGVLALVSAPPSSAAVASAATTRRSPRSRLRRDSSIGPRPGARVARRQRFGGRGDAPLGDRTRTTS